MPTDGTYELNPSSPSNVAPHEIPEKVQVRRYRARTERGANLRSTTAGSERTDPSSDDPPAFYHLVGGLDDDQGLDLADAASCEETMPTSELLCRGDCRLCVSPPKLWFPWSTQAETAEQRNLGLIGSGALEFIPISEFTQGYEHWPLTLDTVYSTTV